MKLDKKAVQINPNDYANIHTGELLTVVSEGAFTAFDDRPTVTIHYDNYFVISMDTIAKLVGLGLLNRLEKGYIVDFATMIRTKSNALYSQQNKPHTIDTLSVEMDLNYNNLSQLLKKFVKKGILAKFTTQDKTMYVMNPYIAKRSRHISTEVEDLFTDFNSCKGE